MLLGLTEFGLVLSDFEEGSEKQGFTELDDIKGDNSMIEYLNESYLEEGKNRAMLEL